MGTVACVDPSALCIAGRVSIDPRQAYFSHYAAHQAVEGGRRRSKYTLRLFENELPVFEASTPIRPCSVNSAATTTVVVFVTALRCTIQKVVWGIGSGDHARVRGKDDGRSASRCPTLHWNGGVGSSLSASVASQDPMNTLAVYPRHSRLPVYHRSAPRTCCSHFRSLFYLLLWREVT